MANVRSTFEGSVHLVEGRHAALGIFLSNCPADCYNVDRAKVPVGAQSQCHAAFEQFSRWLTRSQPGVSVVDSRSAQWMPWCAPRQWGLWASDAERWCSVVRARLLCVCVCVCVRESWVCYSVALQNHLTFGGINSHLKKCAKSSIYFLWNEILQD